MKIAETSTPDLRSNLQHLQSQLLSQLESSIKILESQPPGTPPPETLSSVLTQLSSVLNLVNLQPWKLSYRLRKACIELSTAAGVLSSSHKVNEEHSMLRQISAPLQFLADEVTGVPSTAFNSTSFYNEAGLIWCDLRKFGHAGTCFENPPDITSKIDTGSDSEERKLLLDLNIARSQTARKLSDLTITLSKTVLFGSAENYRALANQCLIFGKTILSENKSSSVNESLKHEALDLSEKVLRIVKRSDETLVLKELKSKTLRFIAASHLQRDEFEIVLKCGRVCNGDSENHPSVLAMKAWLGLERYGEVEKEKKAVVVDKGISERVWVSVVELYLHAVGAAEAETAKGIFLGLLGRWHVSAGGVTRVVHRVIGEGAGSEGSRVTAKVVAEVVSDERVVALFPGVDAAKERTAMHAVLWNRAADHFKSKDYETNAEMFEKSLLYVPRNTENIILRAKGFRAEEYIHEAEKLESNIACAFLKFKIYLQENGYNSAITQEHAMSVCLNFSPDLFCLLAHEAVACRALLVAVASLSVPLNYYSSGKHMPTSEVIGPGTLVTILTQDPSHDSEVLKYIKRAHTRLSELGPDSFLGEDKVRIREQNWFPVQSWNIGLRTRKDRSYELSSEFFKLASQFFGVIVDGEMDGDNVMVCNSIMPTVAAMLVDNEKMVTFLNTEVEQAIELLDRTGKMLFSCSAGSRSNIDQITNIEPNFFFKVGLKEDEHPAGEGSGLLDHSGSSLSDNTSLMFQHHDLNPRHLLYMTGLLKYAIGSFITKLLSGTSFVLVGSSGRASYLELFRPNTRDTTQHNIPFPITIPHRLLASDGFEWVVMCEAYRITYLNLVTNHTIHLPAPPIPDLEDVLLWDGIAGCFCGIPGRSRNQLLLVCPGLAFFQPNLMYWDGEWSEHWPNLEDWHATEVTALAMTDRLIFVAVLDEIYIIEIRDDPLSLVTIRTIGLEPLANRLPNIMSLTHEGPELYLISVILPNYEFGVMEVLRVQRISEVGELTTVEDVEGWMRIKSIFMVHGRRGQILSGLFGRLLSGGRARVGVGFRSVECCEVRLPEPPNIIKLCSGHPRTCQCNFAWCVDCF